MDALKKPVIEYVGMRDIPSDSQESLRYLTDEYVLKVLKKIHDLAYLRVHVKAHQHAGGKIKYSMHIRANSASITLEACEANSYDITAVTHEAFRELLSQADHRLKKTS